MLKKLLASVILASLLLTILFIPYARAQGTWYNQDFREWWTKVYDENSSPSSEIFGERYTAAQVEWIIYGLFAFVLNKATGDPQTTACLMNSDIPDCIERLRNLFAPPQQQSFMPEGIFSFLLADRPLSGITYFKEKARDLNLIPKAQAQQPGFGFQALDPILPIWTISRNLSYALFVIVILIMAFMIMFRVKISPQIVITVQSALPKLAIALILITFSYAIAGLLVDLMYVVIGLISLVVSQVFAALEAPHVSPPTIFGFLTQGFLGTGITGIVGLYWILFLFVSVYVLLGVNGLGGFVLGGLLGFNVVLTLMGVLLTIILGVLLIFIGIKILWMLLKAFVSVLLLVIVAPFQITFGVVLSGVGFGSWLRSFISNLAVFPLTGLLISLSFIFLGMAVASTFEGFHGTLTDFLVGVGFSLPGIQAILSATQHQGWPPLLIFGVQNTLGILYLGVSVVILFILPKTADIIKAMIERRPFAYGTAIGEAFGPAKAGLTGYGLYSAAQIAERKTPKPFGQFIEVGNWMPETQEAVSSILRAIFGRK